jgi:hypothetical protein
VPVAKETWGAKVGVVAPVAVVLSRMETVSLPLFATAKSGFPSPLMSPMLTEEGSVPVGKVTWVAKVGVVAPVAVVLSRMETVLLLKFATAKSGRPSPLMSPMLTDLGPSASREGDLGGESGGGGSGGGGVEQDGDIVAVEFAVAKSGRPSPLMSPMLTEEGPSPVGK